MSNARCKKHLRLDCSTCETGTYARRTTSANSTPDPLTDPLSPLHQAVYGSGDTSPSTSCESSPPSSSSTYDSGSSSSSYDSGSSSSYDSGC
jgi:hypothetical protein